MAITGFTLPVPTGTPCLPLAPLVQRYSYADGQRTDTPRTLPDGRPVWGSEVVAVLPALGRVTARVETATTADVLPFDPAAVATLDDEVWVIGEGATVVIRPAPSGQYGMVATVIAPAISKAASGKRGE